VTGTNGKTSTAWWLAQALSVHWQSRLPSAMIGTLGVGRPPIGTHRPWWVKLPWRLVHRHDHTGSGAFAAQLRRFVDEGLRACAIEASSIGIRRAPPGDGTQIRTAIFTNFTQDHLDYHGTMEAYWQAKRKLFAWPGLQCGCHQCGR
jgi:UDP-N-acetylmuramyl tripeptide synthase